MARDVLSKVEGQTRDEIIVLLGEPSERMSKKSSVGYRVQGVETFADAYVHIHFDANGLAMHSEITGY